jgi:hypothetical protein
MMKKLLKPVFLKYCYNQLTDINPADILSKHWGYSQIWYQLKALLFWKGNTGDLRSQEEIDQE